MTRTPFAVPESFRRCMIEMYKEAGGEWLRRLPAIITACERRWGLAVGPPFAPLSYNYVAPAARADGTTAVLKVGFPCRELMTEIEALLLFEGRGSARLLEVDRERGALLLERLQPGTPLSTLVDDEEATATAAAVMRQLWRPAPAENAFPTVADWARGMERLRAEFGGGTGPFPTPLVEEAEALFRELLSSMSEPALLHGDLHAGNILAAERQPWLAIDPKGLVGEPAYEVSVFVCDLPPERQGSARLARRLDQLAEALAYDRERLRGWALAQSVLSAWWIFEDHGRVDEDALACAELLADMEG